MVSALITRLQAFTALTDEDRSALLAMIAGRERQVGSRRDVIAEGETPRAVNIVIDGWGCRYKQLPDGRRQILSLFLPGDLCDANVYVLKRMDHSVGAITPMTIADVEPQAFVSLVFRNERFARAVWWNELVMMAIQREWTASLGQRSARERIAHLFCETFHRLRVVGRAKDGMCEFPLTQADIGDATGLTPVHVNRMVQELRRDRLIELSGRTLTLLDPEGLARTALFNANYLHLDQSTAGEQREE